ncbi:MAG: hypothetical protein RQ899_10640 [Pseudomonadales bacterium]|nr:hypothetical protein [Pseudomonadales bacterium]
MKTKDFFSMFVILSVLSACSTVPQNAEPGSARNGTYLEKYDQRKIQAYENASRRAGVRVYWVNAPLLNENL